MIIEVKTMGDTVEKIEYVNYVAQTTDAVPRNTSVTYQIMHKERVVATITDKGKACILDADFLPYDLWLEEEMDFDSCLNNINVFNHWCASRVLSLDRKYAKEIYNSLGFAQATTDKDRAKVSLSYHCVSLGDVFWVRTENESITFKELNLYDNPLNEAIVELSLKGRQMTVTNQELAPDLSTKGCFPKAWIRENDGFVLLKDGGERSVKKELLASRICQCFDIPQVVYEEHSYKDQLVTKSKIITTKDRSIVSKMSFDIYAANHGLDTVAVSKTKDPITYYGMNILDYLVGNTDRHPENWGFWVDNETNKYLSLYPIMDFNESFGSYDTLDGAKCQTETSRTISQREAAIEAVKHIGLPMKDEIKEDIFEGFEDFAAEKEMFFLRLAELKKVLEG